MARICPDCTKSKRCAFKRIWDEQLTGITRPLDTAGVISLMTAARHGVGLAYREVLGDSVLPQAVTDAATTFHTTLENTAFPMIAGACQSFTEGPAT